MKEKKLILKSKYQPAGDQPKAIDSLVEGIHDGLAHQTMLGVTGSGKTFTMAKIIDTLQRPAIILAPNKTLAAQLYAEMKELFPANAVEYFVSYYDYYQPEAYVPSSGVFIEKDASINEQVEQMRLSATKALLSRPDVIIVATVSSIYGLGDPELYLKMVLHLSLGEIVERKKILSSLTSMQYSRNDTDFTRGCFRVRGDVIDVFPADSDSYAIRIELFDEEVEKISLFDPITGKVNCHKQRTTIFPKTHYVTPKSRVHAALKEIKHELIERLAYLREEGQLVEHQRLEERTLFDLEMMNEMGYCSGIENYSRYLTQRSPGAPPPCLFDYFPENSLLFIDESHVTIPQLGAMYKGDRARKENLVNYGFRLPSALDNRPLKFEEFIYKSPQTIYVSATPGTYEHEHSDNTTELIVRPTGLVDPQTEVRSASHQVEDILGEISKKAKNDERVLITTLTKRMAEDLCSYLQEHGVRVKYLHSDIDTVERVEIIRDFRQGLFDVLIGINLLREGLDMPEVSLVAIFDADKQGFLRSKRSLIQTIGRAARHINGRAILYASRISPAMQEALDETNRRRLIQEKHNQKHNITPKSVMNKIKNILDSPGEPTEEKDDFQNGTDALKGIACIEKEMYQAAENLDFEKAASLRDELLKRKKNFMKHQ